MDFPASPAASVGSQGFADDFDAWTLDPPLLVGGNVDNLLQLEPLKTDDHPPPEHPKETDNLLEIDEVVPKDLRAGDAVLLSHALLSHLVCKNNYNHFYQSVLAHISVDDTVLGAFVHLALPEVKVRVLRRGTPYLYKPFVSAGLQRFLAMQRPFITVPEPIVFTLGARVHKDWTMWPVFADRVLVTQKASLETTFTASEPTASASASKVVGAPPRTKFFDRLSFRKPVTGKKPATDDVGQ